jgi:hypothetical protein
MQVIAYRPPELKIVFSKHIEDKLSTELSHLSITKADVEDTVFRPDQVLFDPPTGRNVAVRMEKKLAVVFEKRAEDIFIITAIYSSNLEHVISRRKRSGRWL